MIESLLIVCALLQDDLLSSLLEMNQPSFNLDFDLLNSPVTPSDDHSSTSSPSYNLGLSPLTTTSDVRIDVG